MIITILIYIAWIEWFQQQENDETYKNLYVYSTVIHLCYLYIYKYACKCTCVCL
jgi:hypothetical protein